MLSIKADRDAMLRADKKIREASKLQLVGISIKFSAKLRQKVAKIPTLPVM